MIQPTRQVCWPIFGLMMLVGGGAQIQAQETALSSQRQAAPVPIAIGIDFTGVLHQDVGRQNIQAAWDLWYEELGTLYGLAPKVSLYEDLQALIREFNAGALDIVSTSALNYLRMAPQVDMNRSPELYGVVTEGRKMSQYLVVVRAGAGVSELNELQGKTLIVRRGDETGLVYLQTLLMRHGQPAPAQFFLDIQEAESFSKAVLAVFFQQGEACLTTQAVFETMVELNPQVGAQLQILARSPELANGVFFFHQHLPPEIKEILITHLVDFETSVSGQQILLLYKIDRLVQFAPADLDSLSELLQEYATQTHQ